ncbi:Myb-like DNA-binding domain containing protein [Tritrichomonas foetus]|uniref:Myb-like DNA-binding domain containing protein n=1 Tax=Tritrichomonas foetus TaxID=1144522 RepID=A0A1J4JZV4_9EUKA|nr:Myb-like DNA-binding domain containing protein [Tritrichomonas foetus]|eukprot:OHT04218.1 Myb-like DNA-binding domain containing protein [Tritrichomonas foetus]
MTIEANKAKLVRHKFSAQEDQYLRQLISVYGPKNWQTIASQLNNRTARQCRERWKNYLCPAVNNEPFTKEEDELLFKKYAELGKQWSKIAKFFKDRTDINIKNRWATLTNQMKRKSMLFESLPNNPENTQNQTNATIAQAISLMQATFSLQNSENSNSLNNELQKDEQNSCEQNSCEQNSCEQNSCEQNACEQKPVEPINPHLQAFDNLLQKMDNQQQTEQDQNNQTEQK